MEEKEPISTKAALARAAGCCPNTVLTAITKRRSISMPYYKKLADVSGIELNVWISGDRRILKRELKEFFRLQKYGC